MSKRSCCGCCSIKGICKFVLNLLIILLTVLTVLNVNLYGDEWRHRPWWLTVFDRIVPFMQIRKYKLVYGDESDLAYEGLKELVESLNSEAALTRFGKLFAWSVLREQLSQRHCVNQAIAEKKRKNVPLIEPAGPPVVILGLPRTSTTFVHGLLAEDEENFRAPRFHEYMQACPPANEEDETKLFDKLRIEFQSLKMFGMRQLMPNMSSLHHMTGRTPEEDVVPLGHEMYSPLYSTTFRVASYEEWLQRDPKRKMRLSLLYLKEYLDIHLRRNSKRWLLKTPWHVAQVAEFVEVFPGTTFIWTHRDPVQQASSLASLANKMVGVASDFPKHVEGRQIVANKTVEFWYWALERGVKARKLLQSQGKGTFIDVSMESVQSDAVGVAKKIYEKCGWTMSNRTLHRLIDFAERNAAGKPFGKHHHNLQTFDIKEDMIRQRYEKIMKGLELNFVA